MARDCQGWVSPGSLGSPGLVRSRLTRGALVGSLLKPSVYGLSAIPDMTAHPIASWPVALVPPAVQGVNWNAQHFRDISQRHQLVAGLHCHDHLLSVDGKSIEGLGRSIQPLNSPDLLRFRRFLRPISCRRVLSIEELSIVKRPKSRSGDVRS
jgi:hypothetical protein